VNSALPRLEALRSHLSQFRFFYSCELEIQVAIGQLLQTAGIPAQREFRLSEKDRLDFFIDGLVIEVKIGGSAADVMRQVARYAEHEKVQGVLLVTTKARHTLPDTFNGKPLLVHSLLDGAF
jgi:hypothetical protein